jgi:hypothetical protein
MAEDTQTRKSRSPSLESLVSLIAGIASFIFTTAQSHMALAVVLSLVAMGLSMYVLSQGRPGGRIAVGGLVTGTLALSIWYVSETASAGLLPPGALW